MDRTSTSTERTYRYVRVAIVGAAAVVAITVVVVWSTAGPVSSISALYYTPGRTPFTGALFAVALGLVSLAGHSPQRLLMQLAALSAPLIAIIPAPLGPGDAPGPAGACPTVRPCVPAVEWPAVRTGLAVYLVAAVLALIAAAVLARVQHTLTSATAVALGAAALGVGALAAWAGFARPSLLAAGHMTASGVFFGLITAVVVISAVSGRGRWRPLYLVVAVGMGLSLAYLTAVFIAHLAGVGRGAPLVLIGESVLLALFAAYWLAQTVQKWDEADPALIG